MGGHGTDIVEGDRIGKECMQLDVVIPSSKTSTTDSGGGSSLTNKITTGADTDEVGGVTGIKTSALGSGTALKHLLPYKVVMFIRFVG